MLKKKKKDPEDFLIPQMTGDLVNEKVLANLTASINVIPYPMFTKLALNDF